MYKQQAEQVPGCQWRPCKKNKNIKIKIKIQAEQHQVLGMSVEAVYHLLMGPPSSICALGILFF
jgi:hypothetical protein